MKKQIEKSVVFTILLFIKFYRLCVSPLLISHCRYLPTCSEYSMIAIKKYGCFKGIWIALKRIYRCNPFSKSGWDPVP